MEFMYALVTKPTLRYKVHLKPDHRTMAPAWLKPVFSRLFVCRIWPARSLSVYSSNISSAGDVAQLIRHNRNWVRAFSETLTKSMCLPERTEFKLLQRRVVIGLSLFIDFKLQHISKDKCDYPTMTAVPPQHPHAL